MKRFISIFLVSVLCIGVVFSAQRVTKVAKGEKMTYRLEPTSYQNLHQEQGSVPIAQPNTRNSGTFVVVDSSTNGYGMVAANTRPLFGDLDEGTFFMSYRQYCGENTTHGQLGGAYSEDTEDWATYTNLNYNGNPPWGGGGVGGTGVGQARYPSAAGSADQPLAIWTEYTGITTFGSLYGGRPYYAYDEFGWDGGSFAYPLDIDLLWETDAKDLWVGSAATSFDEDMDMTVVNVVFNDWTRGDRWLFHSEAYEDGYVVFGTEQKVIDEVNDLVGGDDTGSFNTSPYVSCTPDGMCAVGVVGLFLGADNDASSISNYHTGIFKMSDDHGASWYGCDGDPDQGCAPSTDGDNYYFIPDAVWDDLVATQFNYEYVDECAGTTDLINDFWSYYEDDFKVDANGNPHWSIQVLGCGAEYCYYVPESGIYHFTIDREYLDNPGPVNTATGWNWSFVISGSETWSWADMTGDTYIWNNHSPMSFSTEDTDIMYIVSNMANPGTFAGDPANLEDPCYLTTWEDYPNWSEDIYVIKSEDGGITWWNPLNVTNTPDETGQVCPNGYPKCDPAEEFPHTAQWATDDQVYMMYQMPNWAFNEIGDLLGADFMNRVYAGYATVDDSDIPPYEFDDACYADAGDVTDDGIINVLDIISLVNHILGTAMMDDTCAADYNGDEIVNVLDIIGLVNNILGIGRTIDAVNVEVMIDENTLSLNRDGFVSAVQFTLNHSEGFELTLTEDLNAMIGFGACNSSDTETTCIVVGLEGAEVLTANSDFSISEFIAVGGSGYLDVMYDQALPTGYEVSNAFPNPFNPTTSLTVDLDQESFVSVGVYNVMGQQVAQLFNGQLSGYGNEITWDASSVPSGVYFINVQVDNSLETKKVMLLK